LLTARDGQVSVVILSWTVVYSAQRSGKKKQPRAYGGGEEVLPIEENPSAGLGDLDSRYNYSQQ
jgi:hypothetical protein